MELCTCWLLLAPNIGVSSAGELPGLGTALQLSGLKSGSAHSRRQSNDSDF